MSMFDFRKVRIKDALGNLLPRASFLRFPGAATSYSEEDDAIDMTLPATGDASLQLGSATINVTGDGTLGLGGLTATGDLLKASRVGLASSANRNIYGMAADTTLGNMYPGKTIANDNPDGGYDFIFHHDSSSVSGGSQNRWKIPTAEGASYTLKPGQSMYVPYSYGSPSTNGRWAKESDQDALMRGELWATLVARVGRRDGEVRECSGITVAGVGGGRFRWHAGNTDTAVTGMVGGATSAGRWKRVFSGPVNVQWFGAVPDRDPGGSVGSGTDSGPAFRAALSWGSQPVFVPAATGRYRIVGAADGGGTTGGFTINAGGLLGDECHQLTSGQHSTLIFEGCPDYAIRTRQSTFSGGFIRLENVHLLASSWAQCAGYGLDLETPVLARNVYVTGFARSGIWLHHNAGVISGGPYQSRFEHVISQYNGAHGMLVGDGANNITLIDYQGKWNGSPSYLVQPSAPGTGDGFHVDDTADGGSYTSYVPQGLVIIGGDCSYNAGYGWNFETVGDSHVCPGYCEGNHTNQVRFRHLIYTKLFLTQLQDKEAGVANAADYGPYGYHSRVFLSGKQIYPATFWDRVLNPTLPDLDVDGATWKNAPRRTELLARSDSSAESVYTTQNLDAEGNELDAASYASLNFRCSTNAAISLGGTTRYLKITPNKVRLPDIFYMAQGAGWGAAETTCARISGRATAGAGQSIPDGGATATLVTLTEESDFGSCFAASVFTAPYSGDYMFTGHIAIAINAGYCQVALQKNGSGALSEGMRSAGALGGQGRADITDIVTLTAGDTVGLYAYQASGSGAQNIVVARLSWRHLWG